MRYILILIASAFMVSCGSGTDNITIGEYKEIIKTGGEMKLVVEYEDYVYVIDNETGYIDRKLVTDRDRYRSILLLTLGIVCFLILFIILMLHNNE